MFIYYKESSVFRYVVFVNDGLFVEDVSASTDTWLHVAIVYRGPNESEGFTVYHDGVDMGRSVTTKTSYNYTGTSTVKIGRLHDEPGSALYGSAYVDELLFFNYQLSPSQINMIKNAD